MFSSALRNTAVRSNPWIQLSQGIENATRPLPSILLLLAAILPIFYFNFYQKYMFWNHESRKNCLYIYLPFTQKTKNVILIFRLGINRSCPYKILVNIDQVFFRLPLKKASVIFFKLDVLNICRSLTSKLVRSRLEIIMTGGKTLDLGVLCA